MPAAALPAEVPRAVTPPARVSLVRQWPRASVRRPAMPARVPALRVAAAAAVSVGVRHPPDHGTSQAAARRSRMTYPMALREVQGLFLERQLTISGALRIH